MDFLMIVVLAILGGVIYAFIFAALIVSVWLYKSNDSGNSVAKFSDFTQRNPLHMIESRDRVSLPPEVSTLGALVKRFR